eukprot:961685-Amphidinium_carterae.1
MNCKPKEDTNCGDLSQDNTEPRWGLDPRVNSSKYHSTTKREELQGTVKIATLISETHKPAF